MSSQYKKYIQKLDKINLTQWNKRKSRYMAAGYACAKWMIFCEHLLKKNFNVYLYEARKSVSKYIYVEKKEKIFKVRFSNHGPHYTKVKSKVERRIF